MWTKQTTTPEQEQAFGDAILAQHETEQQAHDATIAAIILEAQKLTDEQNSFELELS